MYVTERCVFELTDRGLALTEIAPGVDLERDILARMDFEPYMPQPPRLMEAAIFNPAPMELRERMLAMPLAARFWYDAGKNILFIDFERLRVASVADVTALEREVEALTGPLGHRVYAIVNYDHFESPLRSRTSTPPWSSDSRSAATRASRVSTSGFLRAKLGAALNGATFAHVYESAEEALRHVRDS